jgi:hypothetical protein
MGGFIEMFPYVIRYKQGKENVVADALSRKYALLSTLDAKLLGFEYIKELYAKDHEFCEEYRACEKIASGKFFRLDGFLFRENKLCVPNCSMWLRIGDFFLEGEANSIGDFFSWRRS